MANSKKTESKESEIPIFTALLSIPILVVFLCLQSLAVTNVNFDLLTFSSYIFLGLGTFLLLYAGAKKQTHWSRTLVNGIALIFIVATLLVANSIATVPRGCIKREHRVSMSSFTVTDDSDGSGRYRGDHTETVFGADYPVGHVHVFLSWHYSLRISCSKPANLSGTLYAWLTLVSTPLYFREGLPSWPITFVYGEADTDIDWLSLRYGSESPTRRRGRLEGYQVELHTRLVVEGADYGPLSFTVRQGTSDRITVRDYVVDSQLQNTVAILLCGVFIGVLCLIPARSIKPMLVKWSSPIFKRINRSARANTYSTWAEPSSSENANDAKVVF